MMFSLQKFNFHSSRKTLTQISRQYGSMLDKIPTMNPPPIEMEETNLKKQKASRAMKAYVQKANDYQKFIAKEWSEFNIGKRHLANMMGKDPETFSQEDVNEAIAYLFPSGLYDKCARPVMKPPDVIFPSMKEAQFDETGRPHHFLFYTACPNFYQLLHDAVSHLNKLYDYEDRVIAGKEKADQIPSIDISGTDWYSKEKLEKKLIEKLNISQYHSFLATMERLMEHPYSYIVQDFIMAQRDFTGTKMHQFDPIEPMVLEDGRQCVITEYCKRRTAFANVKVIYPGVGRININGKTVEYFEEVNAREQVLFPLIFTGMLNKVDIEATAWDGGPSGQAGAVRLGISRGLRNFVDDDMREKMRLAGLLNTDFRRSERKKPGQEGARRRYTWKKR